MTRSRSLVLVAALVLLATGVRAAAPLSTAKNELDAYATKPDPAFTWSIDHTISGAGYHGAVLSMTSQTWLDASKVDRPVWKHWLTVIVPDDVRHSTAFLSINGGHNTDPAPKSAAERFAKLATDTHSVVAELDDVPNEPLRFSEQLDRPLLEDEIIAYQQAKFAKDRKPIDLVRLPMVKAGIAGMTAVQQCLKSEAGGKLTIDGFVVSGGSKRAWTTWLAAAIDPRVVAIVPIVINVLDVDATTKHHWEAMGYFSPALKDYVENGIIPEMTGSPGLNEVNRLEDPLNYRARPAMRMPKYIINAVGDEYFPPDNTRFGYHLLPQIRRLRMIPNSKHRTDGTDIWESVTAFYDDVLNDRSLPAYSWRVRKDGAIVVRSEAEPSDVELWQANDPKARDFRVDKIGKAFTSTRLERRKDGTWVGKVEKPPRGWTAYFVELTYPSGGAYPIKFTTEVEVIPDTLPFDWKDARPITAPDGK